MGRRFLPIGFSQINEERFSVLYSTEASRPNKAVNLLVSLLILKQQNQLSDEELIGTLYFDYRFQYALGLESETNRERLCINTLSNFRRRLVEHELQTGETLIQQEMEALTEKMAEFLSLNKDMARMDSTMIASSCKKMTRIELVYTVIRNMVRELSKAQEIELPEMFASYLEKGHQNKTIYQTRSTKEGSKLEHLLFQAVSLRNFVEEMSTAQDSRAYQHLCRLLQEQMVETEEGIAIPIEGKKIAPSSLQNPSDPDATYRNKSGKNHVGSVVNLVEVRDVEKKVSLIMHADVKENTELDLSCDWPLVTATLVLPLVFGFRIVLDMPGTKSPNKVYSIGTLCVYLAQPGIIFIQALTKLYNRTLVIYFGKSLSLLH